MELIDINNFDNNNLKIDKQNANNKLDYKIMLYNLSFTFYKKVYSQSL